MKNKTVNKSIKIGVIGVGVLGGEIVNKFLKKGYTVFIYDRSEERINLLVDKGAVKNLSPKEVTKSADFIFDVTPDDVSSRDVWLGTQGILKGANSNKILIISATLSAAWVDELAKICEKAAYNLFDIAINGGERGFTLLCGGEKDLLNKIKPILKVIGTKIWHFGPVGQGVRYKLILNFLQAVHIVGFTQAISIAKEQQMDIKKVGKALTVRPGGILTELIWEIFQYPLDEATFKIGLITKDLIYAKKLTKLRRLSLLDAVLEEYKNAISKGKAKDDWTSIVSMEE